MSKAKRVYINAETRKYVFDRDGWVCRYCGYGEDLEVDHIFPVSMIDGLATYTEDGLVTSCHHCNTRKASKIICGYPYKRDYFMWPKSYGRPGRFASKFVIYSENQLPEHGDFWGVCYE